MTNELCLVLTFGLERRTLVGLEPNSGREKNERRIFEGVQSLCFSIYIPATSATWAIDSGAENILFPRGIVFKSLLVKTNVSPTDPCDSHLLPLDKNNCLYLNHTYVLSRTCRSRSSSDMP